jgi:hypothetical protein
LDGADLTDLLDDLTGDEILNASALNTFFYLHLEELRDPHLRE